MNIKNLALTGAFIALVCGAVAQEKLSDGTDNRNLAISQNAILELASRNKGLLHTRVALESTAKAEPMGYHVAGLMVYNTQTKNDVVPGIYYNDGTKWVLASGGKATSISYNPETYEVSFIDINGNPVKLDFRKIVQSNQTITTLVDNKNGTYVYTSESGVQTIIDVTADVTNTFEQIINNEKVKSEFITLIKNTGGNVFYKDEKFTFLTKDGEVEEILLKELVESNETLTVLSYLPNSNQLTYQDEKGVPYTFDLGVGSLAYNEKTNVLTYVDSKGKATNLILNKTDLAYNPDKNTLDYTNSNGIVQSITLADIVQKNETLTVLSYLPNSNQLTYQDEKGVPYTFDLGVGSLAYNEKTNVLTYVDSKGKATNLILNKTDLAYNPDKNTLDYTNSNGIVQSITLADMVHKNETLTILDYLPGSNQLTYQDEKGVPRMFDLGTGSLAYDEETNALSYVDAKGKATKLALNKTSLGYNTDKNTLDYTNSNGIVQSITLADMVHKNETLTILDYLPGSNQLTYQDEKGVPRMFDLGTGSLAYDEETNALSYVDAKGKATKLALNKTSLEYDPSENQLKYMSSSGRLQLVSLPNETVTTLKQDALGLKYKNEKDAEVTAKIVSANEKNIIKVDVDFGALLTAQEIQFNQEKAIVSAGTGVKVDSRVKGNEVEYTVSIAEDVIKELKAAMPKFFYMPSIVMPTSEDQITDESIITESGGVFTVRLYDSYKKQFSLSDRSSSVSSPNVTTTLPILPATELDYYVTFYDKTVFTEVKLLQDGILTYKIASDADVTLGSFMNVVFAVKP